MAQPFQDGRGGDAQTLRSAVVVAGVLALLWLAAQLYKASTQKVVTLPTGTTKPASPPTASNDAWVAEIPE